MHSHRLCAYAFTSAARTCTWRRARALGLPRVAVRGANGLMVASRRPHLRSGAGAAHAGPALPCGLSLQRHSAARVPAPARAATEGGGGRAIGRWCRLTRLVGGVRLGCVHLLWARCAWRAGIERAGHLGRWTGIAPQGCAGLRTCNAEASRRGATPAAHHCGPRKQKARPKKALPPMPDDDSEGDGEAGPSDRGRRRVARADRVQAQAQADQFSRSAGAQRIQEWVQCRAETANATRQQRINSSEATLASLLWADPPEPLSQETTAVATTVCACCGSGSSCLG
jgi:hypothetical protein